MPSWFWSLQGHWGCTLFQVSSQTAQVLNGASDRCQWHQPTWNNKPVKNEEIVQWIKQCLWWMFWTLFKRTKVTAVLSLLFFVPRHIFAVRKLIKKSTDMGMCDYVPNVSDVQWVICMHWWWHWVHSLSVCNLFRYTQPALPPGSSSQQMGLFPLYEREEGVWAHTASHSWKSTMWTHPHAHGNCSCTHTHTHTHTHTRAHQSHICAFIHVREHTNTHTHTHTHTHFWWTVIFSFLLSNGHHGAVSYRHVHTGNTTLLPPTTWHFPEPTKC